MEWNLFTACVLVIAIMAVSSFTFFLVTSVVGGFAMKIDSRALGVVALAIATLSSMAAGGAIAYSALMSAAGAG